MTEAAGWTSAILGRYRQRPDVRMYADEFDYIWARYPKQIGKSLAFEAYCAQRRKGVTARKLWDATVLYAKQREGEDAKFTMAGKTFFGPNDRWQEAFEIAGGNGQAKHEAAPLDLQKLMGEAETETAPEGRDEDADPLRDL